VRNSLHTSVISALLIATTAAIATGQNATSSSAPDSLPPRPRTLSRPFRVCAGGDVTLGTNLDPAWARDAARRLFTDFGMSADPDSLAPQLRPFFTGADLVMLNIEGAIGTGPFPRKYGRNSTSCFAFRQPPNTAAALRAVVDSGVTVVGNVANNHAHDAGDAGRDTTISLLGDAGIFVTGADTMATPVIVPSGDTIGVLGFYTDKDSPDARDLAAVRRHVARAVRRYGTVIVTMHLGAEGPSAQRTRNGREIFLKNIDRGNPVAFADSAFAGGATLVIGHGPHVVRAAQWRGTRLAFYSLGNLLTYGPFNLREPMNRGVVACATVDSARSVSAPELRPTMQLAPGVLQPDSLRRTLTLIDSLSGLDFPKTGVTVDSTGVIGRRSLTAEEPRLTPVPRSRTPPPKKLPPKRKRPRS
jgi:poly-gamma-glutamate capsule biosynthesis protein CapA/YwtB (metallophosphatase superfamily)